MANAWDVRHWAEKGNVSERDIFAAVGEALSHWELVEQAIAGMFTLVTVGTYHAPNVPTLRAYSSVVSSHARIQMVRAAVDAWLHIWDNCEFGEIVLALLAECSGWAGRRNEIAHGFTDRYVDRWQDGWYLFPSFYTTKNRPLVGKPSYRYNAEIIAEYSRQFLTLFNRMNEMTSMIGEWHRIEADRRSRQALKAKES